MSLYTKKNDIKLWLLEQGITHFSIIPDKKYGYVVDVFDNVSLYIPEEFVGTITPLDFIPVKFRKIEGSFWCYNNNLTSLEFCPEYISREFDFRFNNIPNLEFCPKHVGTYFLCFGNPALEYICQERDFQKILKEHLLIHDKKELKQKLDLIAPEQKITTKNNKI